MIENKPVVGIAYSDCASRDNEMHIRTYVSRKYYHAIQRSGGIAILIPAPYTDSFLSDENKQKINIEHSKAYLKLVDGIVFAGGEDIDPAYQNEDPTPMLGSTKHVRNLPRNTTYVNCVRRKRLPGHKQNRKSKTLSIGPALATFP